MTRHGIALAAGGMLVLGCASGGGTAAAGGPDASDGAARQDEAAAVADSIAGAFAEFADQARQALEEAGAEEAASETGTTPEGAPAPTAIFTSSQAERGRTAFDESCSECHTTSEFRGRSFQSNWGRRTVYSLFRTVRSTMPDDNPGGLEESVYLDVTAYILSLNGHDAGPADLTQDSPMRDVRLAPPEGL